MLNYIGRNALSIQSLFKCKIAECTCGFGSTNYITLDNYNFSKKLLSKSMYRKRCDVQIFIYLCSFFFVKNFVRKSWTIISFSGEKCYNFLFPFTNSHRNFVLFLLFSDNKKCNQHLVCWSIVSGSAASPAPASDLVSATLQTLLTWTLRPAARWKLSI